MKKIIVLGIMSTIHVIAQVSDGKTIGKPEKSIYESIARINSQHLGNVLSWLKFPAESDQQMLSVVITAKLDKIVDRIESLQAQIEKKLTPAQLQDLKIIKSKVAKHIEDIKNMPKEDRQMWRESLKFKFDLLPQEIVLFSKKIESSISPEVLAQLKELQEKTAGFVEWFKSMPLTDKAALKQILEEKVEKLEKRVSVLKQLGRGIEYQEIKGKIENFIAHFKEMAGEIKNKVIELYEKAMTALKGHKQ